MAFGKIKVDDIVYTDANGNATNVPVEDLATAANGINTNSGNITTNATNIATNTTDIATNATNIASNTTAIATNTTAIATKAPLASPALTGVPTAPTAPSGTNTTQLATTEFVQFELPDITGKADLAGATFTGDVSFDGEAILKGDNTNAGKLTLNCEQNSHAVYIQGPAHSAAATYTLTLPDTAGTNGYALTTDGSGGLSWADYLLKSGGTVTGNVVVTGDLTGTGNITRTGDLTLTGNTDLTGGLDIDGAYTQTSEAVSGVDIDLSTGNYFTKSISTTTGFTFSNPPASGTVGSFVLQVNVTATGVTINWPNGTGGQGTVYWNTDTAPSLTDGTKTHLFVFTTVDGGTTYRGAALVDYTN